MSVKTEAIAAERRERQTAGDLLLLIHKRHEGPGWQVFTELPNGTGARAARRADAVAMGLWPSNGMEIHGYECKVSRSDLRQELVDVGKADAVGKYCDYWWLTIADESIADGLLIPPGWGILVPRNRVLRIVRKATKRKAAPVDRGFVAAMARAIADGTVPKAKHKEVIDGHRDDVKKAIEDDRLYHGGDHARRQLEELQQQVRAFEAASGVTLLDRDRIDPNIGVAVRTVLDAMDLQRGRHYLAGQGKALAELAETAAAHATAIQGVLDAFAAKAG